MMMNNFISFEGGEGTGKSTAISKIKEMLEDDGFKVYITREPGGTKIAEDIRNVILNIENTKLSSEAELMLYAASRAQHISELILPKLKEGYVVLCDRYLDSSVAYQGYARNLGVDEVYHYNKFALNYLPIKTFFIDVTPEIALKRISNRSKQDRLDLEKIDFHQKVYNGYKEIALNNKDRIEIIDGTKDLDSIIIEMYQKIKTLIEKGD